MRATSVGPNLGFGRGEKNVSEGKRMHWLLTCLSVLHVHREMWFSNVLFDESKVFRPIHQTKRRKRPGAIFRVDDSWWVCAILFSMHSQWSDRVDPIRVQYHFPSMLLGCDQHPTAAAAVRTTAALTGHYYHSPAAAWWQMRRWLQSRNELERKSLKIFVLRTETRSNSMYVCNSNSEFQKHRSAVLCLLDWSEGGSVRKNNAKKKDATRWRVAIFYKNAVRLWLLYPCVLLCLLLLDDDPSGKFQKGHSFHLDYRYRNVSLVRVSFTSCPGSARISHDLSFRWKDHFFAHPGYCYCAYIYGNIFMEISFIFCAAASASAASMTLFSLTPSFSTNFAPHPKK